VSTTPEVPGGKRTYSDAEVYQHPREVSNPDTTADDTVTTLWERATENWKLAAVLAVMATLAGAFLLWAVRPLVIAVVANTYVQAIVAVLLVFVAGGEVFRRRERAVIAGQEELDVEYDDERRPDFFRGEFVSTPDGRAFIPYKGRSGWWLFSSWNPYTVADLTQNPAAPRTPAKILVPDALFDAAQTADRGFRAMCSTAAIRPYPHGEGVNMILELPEDGDPDAVSAAKIEMQEAKKDLDNTDRKLTAMERRIEELKDAAGAGREDAKQDLLDYAIITNFSTARDRMSVDDLEELTSEDVDLQRLDEEYAEDNDA